MSDDMHRRLDAARKLSKAGRHDEATAELVWLWENIDRVDPGMEGVRVSFMARDIRELVDKHEAARVRFATIRDRAASLADIDLTTARLRFDWIVLNEVLSEPERTLAWFDGVKNDERYALVLDRCAHRLVDLLEERGRFGDIGRLYRDPVATLAKQHRARLPPPHITAEPDPDVSDKIRPHMLITADVVVDAAALLVVVFVETSARTRQGLVITSVVFSGLMFVAIMVFSVQGLRAQARDEADRSRS